MGEGNILNLCINDEFMRYLINYVIKDKCNSRSYISNSIRICSYIILLTTYLALFST